MRSWSAEELFVRAYGRAAVAVQAVLDATTKLEKLTRPPRRTGFDEDAAGESIGEVLCPTDGGRCECDRTSQGCAAYHTAEVPDGAEQLAEREAAEECSEPQEIDVRLVGFTSCGQDMESYAEGFNEGFAEAQRQQDPDWQPDDDTPNPTAMFEPSWLGRDTDDNLVSVQLADGTIRTEHVGTYAPDLSRQQKLIADAFEAIEPLIKQGAPPEPSTLDDVVAQLCQLTYFVEDLRNIIQQHPNFAGAAASLADSTNPWPSVREDKQQDVSDSILGPACVSPAVPHTSSAPCEREHCLCKTEWRYTMGISRAEHDRAAADHLTPAEAVQRRLADRFPQFATTSAPVKSTPGTGAGSDAPVASTTGPNRAFRTERDWLILGNESGEVIGRSDGVTFTSISGARCDGLPLEKWENATLLLAPQPKYPAAIHDLRQAADLIGSLGHPDDPRDYDYGALAERLSAAANALAPQPKPAFPESGLDMGARLDGASAMFPQHTKHQK